MSIQSVLQVDLSIEPREPITVDSLLTEIEYLGDAFVLRVVDYLLAAYPNAWGSQIPTDVANLAHHFDANSSAVEVAPGPDGVFRLRRRVVEGVEEVAQEAANQSGGAGKLLASAWQKAYALEPSPSEAMTLAIRAVEAAGSSVVVPKSRKGFIGEMAQTVEDQKSWELNLHRAEGYPDHNALIALMLRTLAKAQADRHGKGREPSASEAQNHVQLASTLVAWFASGAIRKAESV